MTYFGLLNVLLPLQIITRALMWGVQRWSQASSLFGAIITAMVLIFLMVGLGVLDYNLVWVNPTYMSSGILGGLIIGVGFIVGGFCPGTSLVAMSTRKVDGLFFLLGGLFGIFLFGETERFYDLWWNFSGYMGRLTIPDWLNLPTGVVVANPYTF